MFESVVYEGYGPSGIALYCEALTDNRNRTAADVRSAFAHHGGNLGTTGSVAFQFERRGEIIIEKSVCDDEEELMMAVAEAGGDDYEDSDEEWLVYTAPSKLMAVKKALEEGGMEVKGAEVTMIANTPVEVTVSDAKKVMRLIDRLEDLDDIQNVYHTMDLTDEIMEALDE